MLTTAARACLLCLGLPAGLAAVYRGLLAAFLARERRVWQAFVGALRLEEPRGAGARGRGVVLVGGRAHADHGLAAYYTLDALLAIAALRRSGCRLPVELWHDHDAALLSAFSEVRQGSLLNDSGEVVLRDVTSTPSGPERFAYGLKPLAMMHTAFDEFLFLDADNVPVHDPTPLFSTAEYETTGAVFWADFKSLRLNHLIWPVLGREPVATQLFDSGQVLMNRARHREALALADFFQRRYARTYVQPPFFFIGDKDMFLLAFLALSAPFHLVAPCGLLGLPAGEGDALCGHSFLHGHPGRPHRPLFMHRVSAKWSSTEGYPHLRARALKRGRLTTGAPGSTSLVVEHREACGPCPHHGPVGDDYRCFDLDTGVDRSAAAGEDLARLWQLEEELLQLRRSIARNASLLPQWWLAWSRYVRQPG